jgi:MoaA/NifB/PqqE/SkfB family radical SAM enzyme
MPKYPKFEKIREIGFKKSILVSYNMLLKKIDKIQKRTSLLSRPISLQIEPTTKCNLKCTFCESPLWDRRGMDMSFSDFKKIIDQFPYLVTLLLQGIGEPLLCKDFFKMIEYCKLKKIIVGITTNGMLMNEEIAKKLVDSKIDYVI